MVLARVLPLLSAMSAISAWAATAPKDCIERGNFFGDDSLQDLSAFDQTDVLTEGMPLHYTPSGYNLCVDLADDRKLISFNVIYGNAEGTTTWELPTIGPEGDTCTVINAPVREFPRALRIYQNGKGINAI